MSGKTKIRWGWLKGMYVYTIVGAGGFGLAMLFIPQTVKTIFRWPVQEPIAFGVIGSIYMAFGLLSILGLRSPIKFVPILLLSLCYKSIWFIAIIIPLIIVGQLPDYALLFVIIHATYIVGNLIAIPFPHIFARQTEQ